MKPLYCLLTLALIFGCSQPQPPEYFGFGSISVGQGLSQYTELSTDLKFYNPNSFDVQLNHAEASVYLSDRLCGKSVLDTTIDIHRRDTFYVPILLKIDLGSVMSNALSFLSKSGVKVVVEGKLRLKRGLIPFTVPIHYEGRENLQTVLQNY